MTTTTLHMVVHSTTQGEYTVRQEMYNGRQYTVVPVVMMVEGVHHGSGGPILHLQENFSRNPEDWNGVPLTAGHPTNKHGEYVSAHHANDDEWVVGHVANAFVLNGKLKAEAWIDEQRAVAINPEVVNYITEGKRLEVSTGASTHDIQTQGEWNGETYEAITEYYTPDHLALLPGDRGACSWSDGCGIRNNKSEDHNEMSQLKDQLKNGFTVLNGLQTNKTGFVELSRRVQTLLDRRDSEARLHFLKEVYDDHFVYEVRDSDQGKQTFYRQEYVFNEDQDQVSLDGMETEVRRNVEYVPIQRNQDNKETSDDSGCGCSMKRTKFNNNTNQTEDDIMSDTKKDTQPSGDVMEKVVSLTNNERTRFGRSDREWLLQLNEAQLDKLVPTELPEPTVTREDALQALQEDLSDTDKLLNIVSDDIKDQIEVGIKTYKEKREKLVTSIQANTKDIWAKDKLESMDTETLEAIEKSSRKVDYSGQGPINNNSQGADEGAIAPMLPNGVELKS